MFDIGGGELLMILLAVVVLFGPKKLPEIARSIGKVVQQIKAAQMNLTDQMNTATNSLNEEIKKETDKINDTAIKPIEKEVSSLKRDQVFDNLN